MRRSGPWAWLTADAIRELDHVGQHDEKGDIDAAYLNAVKLKENHYMAVILTKPGAAKLPSFPGGKGGRFVSGVFRGTIVLLDLKNKKRLFAKNIEASNSNVVEFRTGGRRLAALFDEDPKEAVKKDFQENVEKAIKAALPKRIKVKLAGFDVF